MIKLAAFLVICVIIVCFVPFLPVLVMALPVVVLALIPILIAVIMRIGQSVHVPYGEQGLSPVTIWFKRRAPAIVLLAAGSLIAVLLLK